MILDWLMFAGGAIGTLVLGLPIVRAVARREQWSHAAARDPSTRKARVDVPRAYTPLDLGIDPVRWPSERLWALQSTLGIPDWPSRSWNDEHFGRHWKDQPPVDASEAGFHAMALRRHREEVHASTAQGATPSGRPRRERAPTPATERPVREEPARLQDVARTKNAGGKRKPGKEQRPASEPRAGKTAPKKPAVASPSAPASTASASPPPPRAAPPDAIELEHLIGTVGLAGTVQAIMQKTGWEFREAAQYLARVRREP